MTHRIRLALLLAATLLSFSAAQADQIQTDRWNGLYVGGHIGSGAFDAEARFSGPGFSGTINGDEKTEFLGGGQLGYNLQTGMFLIGVEGDFSLVDNADLATLRGRLGVATDNLLLYGTAGIGFAWVDDASSDDTLNAFVVGGGAEFDLGQSFRGMTVGLEGLYFAFEEQEGRILNTSFEIEPEAVVVRGKLNYRFPN